MKARVDSFFRLKENGTSIQTEVLAGITTFLTMAYILFVNPMVLSTDFAGNPTGLDAGAVLLATAVCAAGATLVMGLWARHPIALAPGMGSNFFFVSVIMTLGGMGFAAPWRTALGIVFISGVIFLLLSVFKVREAVIDAISPSLKAAIACGIGLFIAFIGLKNGKVVVENPGTYITLTDGFFTLDMAVFFAGLLVTAGLMARKVRGAILWGILAATGVALAEGAVSLPSSAFGLPHIKQSAIFQMDLITAVTTVCIPFIIIFVFMDMFDTVGTLIGVAEAGNLLKDNKLPRANRALLADAAGTVAGACMGTSTVTSYIESAAGVEQGGRTGLTAVVTALLFLAALFFSPIITAIGSYAPITAPALVVVGSLMAGQALNVDWKDFTEAFPGFLIMVGIPLSFSIADGLAMGFVMYPIVKVLGRKGREVPTLMYVLGTIMLAYFLFTGVQAGH